MQHHKVAAREPEWRTKKDPSVERMGLLGKEVRQLMGGLFMGCRDGGWLVVGT